MPISVPKATRRRLAPTWANNVPSRIEIQRGGADRADGGKHARIDVEERDDGGPDRDQGKQRRDKHRDSRQRIDAADQPRRSTFQTARHLHLASLTFSYARSGISR
ncbi:hypothetical protein [Bradyrhizobium sp. RDT46]|uniref:hypothetical protein n=1 Tax=Bradyrhizobium sp. RDT46 TaxID=3341829 RepID=UPI0035C668E8